MNRAKAGRGLFDVTVAVGFEMAVVADEMAVVFRGRLFRLTVFVHRPSSENREIPFGGKRSSTASSNVLYKTIEPVVNTFSS